MTREIVYLGHDNSVDLLLKADDVAVDLSSVTQITLTVDGTTITSTGSSSGPIRWSGADYDTGEVRLFLGDQTLSLGKRSCPLVVYDPTNTDGVVWGDVKLEIKAEVEAS